MSELRFIAAKNKDSSSTDNNNSLKSIINSIEFTFSHYLKGELDDISNEYLGDKPSLAFIDFIQFIGNVRELDKSETFGYILRTMNKYEGLLKKGKPENSEFILNMINSLRTYSVINNKNMYLNNCNWINL